MKKFILSNLIWLTILSTTMAWWQFCIQVIQPAYNPITWECKNFPTPCDVPQWWIKVNQCKVIGVKKYQFLTEKEKKLIDQFLNKFFKKLYKYDLETQIKKLQKIINKIDTILPKFENLANQTKSQKYTKIVDLLLYLKEKISKQISLLQINLEAIKTESGE